MTEQIYTRAQPWRYVALTTFGASYIKSHSDYWMRWLTELIEHKVVVNDEGLNPGDTALIDEYLKSYTKGAILQ